MEGHLFFNVCVEISDPPCRVEHNGYDKRVAVVIRGPGAEHQPVNLLRLWFTSPETVVNLGRELASKGMRLAAQLQVPLSDPADPSQVSDPEGYPVPTKKPDGIEPDKNRESGADPESSGREVKPVLDDSHHSAMPDATYLEHDREWSSPLWDDGWEGEFGSFGDVHLCVATKKWASGTVDVLVAHDPYTQDGTPTAFAHRHGVSGAAPLITYGSANVVVATVIDRWELPVAGRTEGR